MLMFCGVFVEDKKLDSKLHMWGLKRNTSVYISEKISTSVLLSGYICSYINTNDLFQYQTRMLFVRVLCKECPLIADELNRMCWLI